MSDPTSEELLRRVLEWCVEDPPSAVIDVRVAIQALIDHEIAQQRARYEALVEAATEFAYKFHATYEMNQATGKLGNALAALREECPG